MRFLRQNTAVRITVGPFFDKTDGITPETALTVTNCKLTLMVDDDDGTACNLVLDAAATASGGNNDMVHVTNDDAGFYDLELTQAQTNYVGRAMLAITDAANHCPVFHEFMIVPANVYDSLFGTDKLQVDSVEISSDSGAADNLEAACDGNTYNVGGGAIVAASVTTKTGYQLAADQAVNATKIGGTTQTGRDLGASVLISPGTGAGQLDVTSGVIKANLAQILGTALTETAGQIAAGFKKVFDVATPVFTAQSVNQTGDAYAKVDSEIATIDGKIDTIDGNVDTIKTKTDSLTFTVANKLDSNVYTWNGTAVTAPAIAGSPVVTLNATQAAYTPAKAGDAMTLSDDAITASKFDESTAFPIKSADTGATAIARTGADSDTLETLSDQIDGASTFNPASDAVTLAALQGLYAPAKAGDAMTLTEAYDAAKTAAAAGAKMDIVDAPNATGLAAIADAFLKRDWTSVTGEATRSVLNALRPLLNKWTSASGAGGYVVKKEDDSTTAWTGTLTVDENGNISGMDHD